MMSFSNRLFFSMGEDQAHEQNNKSIKTDAGAIGLFDNANALAEWQGQAHTLQKSFTVPEDLIKMMNMISRITIRLSY